MRSFASKIQLVIFGLLLSINVNALSFTYDGINYAVTSVKDLTVCVIEKGRPYSYYGDLIIPETVIYNDKTFTVTEIDSYAFVDNNLLTGITFPKTIEKLGKQLFNNCQNLKFIKVDADNKYFCDIDGVMYNKEKTKIIYYPNARGSSYTLPSTTKIIGELAFGICWGLKSIELNEGLQYIEYNAFYYAKELTSITFPASMISTTGFDRCTGLKKIIVLSENPFEAYFDDHIYLNATLYVPIGSKSKYESAYEWGYFFDIREIDVTGIEEITSVPTEVSRFDINGNKLQSPTKGINIIKMSDGSTQKVIVE